jgi:hypothetical protein
MALTSVRTKSLLEAKKDVETSDKDVDDDIGGLSVVWTSEDGPVTVVNSLSPKPAATDIILGQYSVASTEIVRDRLARGIVPLYTRMVSSCKPSREAVTHRVDRVTALEHAQKGLCVKKVYCLRRWKICEHGK